MPPQIYCDNFPACPNPVTHSGLCPECQRKAQKAHDSRWMYAGFTKSKDNERHEHNSQRESDK